MEVHLFKFHITNFEEVYAVLDVENNRLHISPLNYSFNLTLSLNGDLHEQLAQNTQWGEMSFNANVRKVAKRIIDELQLKFNENSEGNTNKTENVQEKGRV